MMKKEATPGPTVCESTVVNVVCFDCVIYYVHSYDEKHRSLAKIISNVVPTLNLKTIAIQIEI